MVTTRWASLTDWRLYSAQAAAADSSAGQPPPAATEAAAALRLGASVLGHAERALDPLREELEAALRQQPLRTLYEADRPYLPVAQAFAWAGHPARARALVEERRAEVRDTALLRWEQPDLHTTLGVIAQAEGRTRDALAEFRLGDVAPDGPANECNICLPIYLALTFDAAGMADSAIAQFEAYIDTPSSLHLLVTNDPDFNGTLDAWYLPGAHDFAARMEEAGLSGGTWRLLTAGLACLHRGEKAG